MNDLDERLARCFLGVFPELGDQVVAAGAETTPEWDSLHTLMLIAVIEETFEVAIPASCYPQLRSYAAARSYLESLADGTAGMKAVTSRPGIAESDRRE
jgi:acyl carrier protein